MKIEKVNIKQLKMAEYNPRKDLKPEDEEYQKIKMSLTEYGCVVPLVINKDYTVIRRTSKIKNT